METIEHFAKISLVARQLGRENLLSRDEVERLQGLRGMYGIAAPAPICADDPTPTTRRRSWIARWCRRRDSDERLVPDDPAAPPATGTDGEIRLTYRELSALIEDAMRS